MARGRVELAPRCVKRRLKAMRYAHREPKPTRFTYLLVALLLHCTTALCADPLYFESPEKAVIACNELVRKQDWKTLARYYDLAGTGVKLAELESGEFFIRKERPANADPMGFWKTRHPFPPGFNFTGVEKTDDPAVVKVLVAVEIDQGGGPKQRSVASFFVRKSPQGWRALPPKG
jgi:hypothetical protein